MFGNGIWIGQPKLRYHNFETIQVLLFYVHKNDPQTSLIFFIETIIKSQIMYMLQLYICLHILIKKMIIYCMLICNLYIEWKIKTQAKLYSNKLTRHYIAYK